MKLFQALIYSIVAAGCFALANYGSMRSIGLRWFIVVVGILAAFFALAASLDWIATAVGHHARIARKVAAITPASELADRIHTMTADQLEIAERLILSMDLLGGEPGPIYTLRTPYGPVPLNYVYEFIQASDDQFLAPIRSWPEGTSHRKYAEVITRTMIYFGYADPAVSNHPARWKNEQTKNRALRFMGVKPNV